MSQVISMPTRTNTLLSLINIETAMLAGKPVTELAQAYFNIVNDDDLVMSPAINDLINSIQALVSHGDKEAWQAAEAAWWTALSQSELDRLASPESVPWYLNGQAYYGGGICPGEQLEPTAYDAKCPECQKDATCTEYERVEGGAINYYQRWSCPHCGYAADNGAHRYD
ncbi:MULTISPECIES: hypothetical protein [Enterobacteriaceae]|uniref:hypothetical protein n=1 Tax=Enterobacteriaceae TaxID=543 RepID=UPI001079DB71|nr:MULTISPECIES: hypothetical protein [Enterobacteriaceae]EAB3464440.1 hypothetical protein [Salmonella enterica]HCQ8543996.1 hypothetical protein [Klebsiella pneumoniae]EBJ8043064.1 hypothetical protein [Salmonella enterica]EDZ5736136.1 hypothetical protein [Salmonella enterica]EFT6798993.1 hypothetical protein [Salmonella enterica]